MAYSKYEILEKTIKATKDKSLTLAQVEKVLKKAQKDSDDNYDESTTSLVVDHFKSLTAYGAFIIF